MVPSSFWGLSPYNITDGFIHDFGGIALLMTLVRLIRVDGHNS